MLLGILAFAFLGTTADKVPATVDDLKAAYQSLRTADEQKDSDAVKKWAVDTIRLGKEVKQGLKAGGEESSADRRKEAAEFIDSTETFAEYALSAVALRDRTKVLEFVDVLQASAPDSKYLPPLFSAYVAALGQSGKSDKAFQFSEKAISKAPGNEDLLLILADGALTRKQWDRASTFGTRLATVISSKARPEGTSAADWDRKKSLLLGRGYYIAGMGYANARKDMQTDKALRAALPYIKGEERLLAPSLFYLGVADYNVARTTLNPAMMREALSFSQQAAAIPGAYQDQAKQNVKAIQAELDRMMPARRAPAR